jgi:DNA-binding transcriptional ArsR family regulator
MAALQDSLYVMAEAKSDLFKALAHPLRVRILQYLSGNDHASIADLAAATGVKASNLSQHVALLRRQRLMVVTRSNGQLFYRLAFPEVTQLLDAARNLLQADLANTRQSLAKSLAAALEQSVLPPELPPNLDEALHSRSIIDRAVRALMDSNSWSAETAQEALLNAARVRNISIRKVAAEVANGGELLS